MTHDCRSAEDLVADIRSRASSAITEVKLAAVEEIRQTQQPAEVGTADTVFICNTSENYIKDVLHWSCRQVEGSNHSNTSTNKQLHRDNQQ